MVGLFLLEKKDGVYKTGELGKRAGWEERMEKTRAREQREEIPKCGKKVDRSAASKKVRCNKLKTLRIEAHERQCGLRESIRDEGFL